MRFPGSQISVPTIIIRKNLNKNRGSTRINSINLFSELDNIFEGLFDSIADSIIKENDAKIKNKNENSKDFDDHIDLDEIDLRLNDTEVHSDSNHKHSKHEEHIKLNYVKDAENNKNDDLYGNELKVEDIDRNNRKDKKMENKIEE